MRSVAPAPGDLLSSHLAWRKKRVVPPPIPDDCENRPPSIPKHTAPSPGSQDQSGPVLKECHSCRRIFSARALECHVTFCQQAMSMKRQIRAQQQSFSQPTQASASPSGSRTQSKPRDTPSRQPRSCYAEIYADELCEDSPTPRERRSGRGSQMSSLDVNAVQNPGAMELKRAIGSELWKAGQRREAREGPDSSTEAGGWELSPLSEASEEETSDSRREQQQRDWEQQQREEQQQRDWEQQQQQREQQWQQQREQQQRDWEEEEEQREREEEEQQRQQQREREEEQQQRQQQRRMEQQQRREREEQQQREQQQREEQQRQQRQQKEREQQRQREQQQREEEQRQQKEREQQQREEQQRQQQQRQHKEREQRRQQHPQLREQQQHREVPHSVHAPPPRHTSPPNHSSTTLSKSQLASLLSGATASDRLHSPIKPPRGPRLSTRELECPGSQEQPLNRSAGTGRSSSRFKRRPVPAALAALAEQPTDLTTLLTPRMAAREEMLEQREARTTPQRRRGEHSERRQQHSERREQREQYSERREQRERTREHHRGHHRDAPRSESTRRRREHSEHREGAPEQHRERREHRRRERTPDRREPSSARGDGTPRRARSRTQRDSSEHGGRDQAPDEHRGRRGGDRTPRRRQRESRGQAAGPEEMPRLPLPTQAHSAAPAQPAGRSPPLPAQAQCASSPPLPAQAHSTSPPLPAQARSTSPPLPAQARSTSPPLPAQAHSTSPPLPMQAAPASPPIFTKRKPQAWVVEDFSTTTEDPPEHPPEAAANCQCPDCGRTFNEAAYNRHVKICKKVFSEKPKKEAPAETKEPRAAPVKKVAKWRQQSEQLQAAMKAAKGGAAAPAVVDDSLEGCVHCGRKFNPRALAKHVEICLKVFKGKKKVQTAGGLGQRG